MKPPNANPDTPDDAWDALFRQQLGDYTAPPPADALNRILVGATPPRPVAYGHWLPVSLAVLLLIGLGGWLFVRKADSTLNAVATAVRQTRPVPQPPRPMAEPAVAAAGSENRMPTKMNPMLSGANPVAEPGVAKTVPDRLAQDDSTQLMTPGPGRRVPLTILNRQPNRQPAPMAESDAPVTTKDRAGQYYSAGRQRLNGAEPRLPAENRMLPGVSDRVPPSPVNNRFQLSANLPPNTGLVEPINGSTPLNSGRREWDAAVVSFRPAEPFRNIQRIETRAGRPFRLFTVTSDLPAVVVGQSTAAPQMSRLRQRPSWFLSLTPLYTYQQIDPIHTDAELVSDIRGARTLAPDRLGGRLQFGTDWRLTNRLRLRTSLVYQQVRQSLRYAVQSTQPDSVQISVVTNQSVQLTPIFTQRSYAETAVWHYVGVSADLVWQLNRRSGNAWQHYITVGTTAGQYISRGGVVNGFVQAAYGVERPLGPGLRLRIEPTGQLGWQALTDANQRLKTRPYGYGLSVGLRFR